jgi:serine/threonine protein kinase
MYKEFKATIENKNTLKFLLDKIDPTPLGKGSFGTIYGSADGKYIVKVIPKGSQSVQDEINANKILMSGVETMKPSSEAFYVQGVDFVTQYKGAFDHNDTDFLVFERAQGSEMFAYLENNPIKNSKDITNHARMGAELANSIAVTHEAGLVHRDIKPKNAMVQVNPDGTVMTKLIDQGIACRNTDQKELSRSPGTLIFMAPECFKQPPSPVSNAVDVYALGVTFVENFFWQAPIKDFVSSGFWVENKPLSDDKIQTANGIIKKCAPDCDLTSFNRQNFFEKILADPEKYKTMFDPDDMYSKDQLQFLCGLIRDCVNPEPTARPSAAQAGYALEIFAACMDDNARIKEHNAKPENANNRLEKVTIPPYQDIMALAKADRPAQ